METALGHAFEAVLGTDNLARKQADDYLKGLGPVPGLVPALLSLANDASKPQVQLSAVVFLKNSLAKWAQVPADERELLKSVILAKLSLSEPEKLRLQYCEIGKKLWALEAPWPTLHPPLHGALTSNDGNAVFAGLTMLHQMTRLYEHKTQDEKRTEVNELTKAYFSDLLRLFGVCLTKLQEGSFSYLLLILQSFWSACYIEVPPFVAETENLRSWLQAILKLLEVDLGTLEAQSVDAEELKAKEAHPAWHCKRWAAQIANRIFSRYRQSVYLEEHFKAIGHLFNSEFSEAFLVVFLKHLSESQSKFRPTLYLNFLLKYCCSALKTEGTHAIIAPHVEALVVHVLLPIMSRHPEDEELWQDDPSEFLRREFDMTKSYYAAKGSAYDLLLAMSEIGHLDKLIAVLGSMLQSATGPLQIEVLLLAIQAVSEPLLKRNDLAAQVPALIRSHVIPLLSNPVGILRFRACSFLRAYVSCKLADELASDITIKVARLMSDSELPVKVEAATTLAKLINWSCAEAILKPELQGLLGVYLSLINAVDLEDLVDALENVIGKFSSDIGPFALELIESLKTQYIRMVNADPNETKGESAIAAVSVLNTLNKTLDSLSPDQLPGALNSILPVIQHTLSKDGCEYFEEGLGLLNTFLTSASAGSLPQLQPLYETLLTSITSTETSKPYASEQIMGTFSPLANFMAKYKPFVESRLELTMAVTQNLLAFRYAALAMKLHVVMFLSFPRKMDAYLEPVVLAAVAVIATNSSLTMRNISSMVVCAALHYDARATVAVVTPHLQPYASHISGRDLEKLQDLDSLKLACLGMAGWLQAQGPMSDIFAKRLACLLQQLDEEGQEAEEGDEMSEEAFYKLLDNIKDQCIEENADYPEDIFEEDLYEFPFDSYNVRTAIRGMLQSQPNLALTFQQALAPEQFEAVCRILNN